MPRRADLALPQLLLGRGKLLVGGGDLALDGADRTLKLEEALAQLVGERPIAGRGDMFDFALQPQGVAEQLPGQAFEFGAKGPPFLALPPTQLETVLIKPQAAAPIPVPQAATTVPDGA